MNMLVGLFAPYTVKELIMSKDTGRVNDQQCDNDLPEEMLAKFTNWSR